MENQEKPATKFFQDDVDNYKKEFYDSGYRTFMRVRLGRFLDEIDKLNLPPDAKCLDAGCGPGYLTKGLCDRGFQTSSLDSSPEMLRLTTELLGNIPADRELEIVEGDIENLPFEDNQFDLATSAGVIEYLASDTKVLGEFHRTLKPGGYLVLSSTHKYSPIGMFEPIIESIKRTDTIRNICNSILENLGGTPVRPRDFHVRKHSMKEFRGNIEQADFEIITAGFFYALPWPHPFDRVFPKVSAALGKLIETTNRTPLKYTFEGIYIVARKKGGQPL